MDLGTIFPTEYTYINSKYENCNFFDSNMLIIDNFEGSKSNILLKFFFGIYNKNFAKDYYLYIPLQNDGYCREGDLINIDVICNYIDYERVTYNDINYMESYSHSYICISDMDIRKGYILADISQLVNKYIQKDKMVMNIMLSSSSKNFSIEFNKEYCNCIPRLMKDRDSYSFNSKKCKNQNVSREIVAMELIRNNLSEENIVALSEENIVALSEENIVALSEENIVKNNDIIKFNKIEEKTPKGIDYLSEEGVIAIYEKGYYLFTWEINIEGTAQIESMLISLKNNTTNKIMPSSASTSIQGQIVGHNLVHVTNKSELFSLINTSGGDLVLSDKSPNASIIIVKI